MRLDGPLPKAGIFGLFVVLPILMMVFLSMAIPFIVKWSGGGVVLDRVFPFAFVFLLLSYGLRCLLSCIDWFEARKAKRVADNG